MQASAIAQAFMDALKVLESNKDTGPIVSLFSEDAALSRLTYKTYKGKADVKDFWQEYLEPFEQVSTDFTHVTENGHTVVLEWESQGKLMDGKEISYRGVSSFDLADDKVKNFRTYYDSAAFVPAANL